MLSFPVKILTKYIILILKIFTKDMVMVKILTVQGKWGHCPPTCNIINEGSSSQPESAPATVISMENNVNNPMRQIYKQSTIINT